MTARASEIVAAARGWIGTPYIHQASLKGSGADCLGLVRGIWREIIGPEPESPPAYSPDWAERKGEETLLAAALRHLVPIEVDEAGPGDVLLYRMRANAPAKHAAILASGTAASGMIIHAYSGHAVAETPQLATLPAAAFRFP